MDLTGSDLKSYKINRGLDGVLINYRRDGDPGLFQIPSPNEIRISISNLITLRAIRLRRTLLLPCEDFCIRKFTETSGVLFP